MKNTFESMMLTVCVFMFFGCQNEVEIKQNKNQDYRYSPFYSHSGEERKIEFEAIFRSKYTSIENFSVLTALQKKRILDEQIRPTIEFLFGPLTRREIGGKQRNQFVQVLWENAKLNKGFVEVPYTVSGTWIVSKTFENQSEIILPVPYSTSSTMSTNWKLCTDSDPEHQTQSFYWYFWDPERFGCDHKENENYQLVSVRFKEKLIQTKASYPEYERMFRIDENGTPKLQMTFAFGYVSDPDFAKPYQDSDFGMLEFRRFQVDVKRQLKQFIGNDEIRTIPILEGEYRESQNPENQIGTRYQVQKSGRIYEVNVVAAANIDQMDLFAQSFAHEHHGFFAWFGHSRVGSGFDAQNFKNKVEIFSDHYSITNDYQMVYWAGCNSYSYYTLPFFEIKGGSQNLDIISNGLPSLFAFNGKNASLSLELLLKWGSRPSYQNWVDRIEGVAERMNYLVLVNVLGDEDNP